MSSSPVGGPYGWRSLSLRQVHEPAVMEDLRIPAADVQRVVLLLHGTKTIESSSGRSWRRATHASGTVSLTAPGRPTRLRWRATAPHPVVTVQATVPGRTVREAAERVWGRNQAPVLDTLSVDDAVTGHLLRAMAAAQTARAPELYAESAAQHLVVHLLTRYAGLPAPTEPGREGPRMARVRTYVADHLGEPVSLVELADVAGLSPWHFLRVFKAEHGTTPMRYLTTARVRAAQELLTSTTRSVTEVAYACGFSSPGHLTTAFSRQLGTTPSRYRAGALR